MRAERGFIAVRAELAERDGPSEEWMRRSMGDGAEGRAGQAGQAGQSTWEAEWESRVGWYWGFCATLVPSLTSARTGVSPSPPFPAFARNFSLRDSAASFFSPGPFAGEPVGDDIAPAGVAWTESRGAQQAWAVHESGAGGAAFQADLAECGGVPWWKNGTEVSVGARLPPSPTLALSIFECPDALRL